MADQQETIPPQPIMREIDPADGIRGVLVPATSSVAQSLRTVSTSMTTGNLSIRYVPRSSVSANSQLDTTN